MALGKISISTHVLDMVGGVPAKDVPLTLEQLDGSGQWRSIASAHTDNNGRCTQLVPDDETLASGIYRLTFNTESYFAAQAIQGLYPVVEVTFHVRDSRPHYHIALLLSPNGYTTYRGA
jgi:5-hydroxyisourate hydrolase